MDEVIGFLLATKNKAGWFTTKEYVDYLAVHDVLEQILSVRFSIDDGELYVEDYKDAGSGEVDASDYFQIDGGILQYNSDV